MRTKAFNFALPPQFTLSLAGKGLSEYGMVNPCLYSGTLTGASGAAYWPNQAFGARLKVVFGCPFPAPLTSRELSLGTLDASYSFLS